MLGPDGAFGRPPGTAPPEAWPSPDSVGVGACRKRPAASPPGAGTGTGTGTGAVDRSVASLDCCFASALTLKRARTAISPGELRLDRDMEAMASGEKGGGERESDRGPWIALDDRGQRHGYGYGHGHGHGRQPRRPHAPQAQERRPWRGSRPLVLRSEDGTVLVRRDPVDPLRLRVSVTFPTGTNPYEMSGWGVMVHDLTRAGRGGGWVPEEAPPLGQPSGLRETWTYAVDVPRMYPHQPPQVRSITREGRSAPWPGTVGELVRDQRRRQQQQQSGGGGGGGTSASHRGRPGPPPVEQVVVSSSGSRGGEGGAECNWDGDDEMTGIVWPGSDMEGGRGGGKNMGTVETYAAWSPISRLSDLVGYLADLPTRRMREWEGRGGNEGGGGGGGAGGGAGGGGTLGGVMVPSPKRRHAAERLQQPPPSAHARSDQPFQSLDHQRRRLSSSEGGGANSSSLSSSFHHGYVAGLKPNRFDKGFDRGGLWSGVGAGAGAGAGAATGPSSARAGQDLGQWKEDPSALDAEMDDTI